MPGKRPGRSLGSRLCVDGAGGRRLGGVSGRGAASEWPGRRACPVPEPHMFWVRSEVALPRDGSEKRAREGGHGVRGAHPMAADPPVPCAATVQVPRPHATGAESRPLSPSTYLTGWASPGTKVSWEQSPALTGLPPSRAERRALTPGDSLRAPGGGSISTSGDKNGPPGCSRGLRVNA